MRRTRRRAWLAALVVVAVAAAVVIYLACFHIPDPGLSAAVAQRQPDAAHGRYIATLGDCAACHSVSGGKALAGGVAFTTPVGVIYSTNITPDRNTGIGYYTFPDFARVMRKGVKPDGTRLYPAMPYPDYTQISDQDLQDLFAYLQTQVAAVAQPTRAVAANWPWTIRWPLGFWNLAFLNDRRFAPDASKSDQWNRGAYLVEALEHCGECHTPRRWTQSLDNGRKFAGAVQQGWKAYNITSSQQSGLGGWSDDAVAAYLMTGHADSHSSAGGPMAEAVADSLSHVSPDDVHAMVAYLRSIPAIEDEPAIAQNPPASTNGKPAGGLGEQVFAGNCANCHDWDGKGVQSPYAALAGSRAVNDPSATNLMTVLLSGSKAKLPAQHVFMPPFERGHSDDELAAVINFVSGYFGNGQAHVTAADIADARKSLPPPQQPTQAADLGERH